MLKNIIFLLWIFFPGKQHTGCLGLSSSSVPAKKDMPQPQHNKKAIDFLGLGTYASASICAGLEIYEDISEINHGRDAIAIYS